MDFQNTIPPAYLSGTLIRITGQIFVAYLSVVKSDVQLTHAFVFGFFGLY